MAGSDIAERQAAWVFALDASRDLVVLAQDSGSVHEIWCALSVRAADGTHVGDELRSILFAALEAHFPDTVFEVRGDWPGGHVEWWEKVRLGLR